MTKTTTTTTTFAIGDRVEADLPTGTATGTLTAISKGWYVVELDEESAEEHEREKASVRAASLRPAPADDTDDDDEIDGEHHDDLGENGNPIPMDDDDDDEIDEALEEAEKHASQMAEALRKARVRYQKTRRPAGAASADCADLIAKELRDYEPLEVAAIADRCFDLPKGTHAAKYAHLNNGQIRMNCGNKIRAAWKKGDDEVCKRIAYVLGLDHDELASIEDRGPEGLEDLQPTEK